MTAPLIITGVVALAAVLALFVVAVNARSAPGPSLVGHTVVIHTRRPDDQSVRGVLVGQHADRYILREAVYLHGETSVDAAGLVHVPVIAVSTIQQIAPVEGG